METKFYNGPTALPSLDNREPLLTHEYKVLIGSTSKLRNKLLIRFLASTGLRIREVLRLKVEHLGMDTTQLPASPFVWIIRSKKKTVKPEMQHLNLDLWNDLDMYLKLERKTHNDYIFDVKYTTFLMAIERLSEQVLGRKITPHDLRRYHLRLLREVGLSITDASKLLGHTSEHTTYQYYATLSRKEKVEAVNRIEV